jgi:hypothetical protein
MWFPSLQISYEILSHCNLINIACNKEREDMKKKEEKDLKDTPKLRLWHYQYIKENSTTPKKVANGDRSFPHEWSKDKWAPISLDDSCGPLRFTNNLWCYHWSFGLSPWLFFFSFFVFFSLLVICEERG